MNIYVKNYWSAYLDFIQDFEELTYKGISISYLCHFAGLVRGNVSFWNALYDEGFSKQFRNQVNDRKEIQKVFNAFVHSHTNKLSIPKKQGKVLINVDPTLRFPSQTYKEHFDSSHTSIIMAGSKSWKKKKKYLAPASSNHISKNNEVLKKEYHNIPIHYLSTYPNANIKDIINVKNKARNLFKKNMQNNLYQDTKFQNIFLLKITEVIHRIEQTIGFLEDISVSCIVVPTTHSFISRTLAIIAAEKGIPTICVQHGIINSEFGFIPKIATVDAVYGYFEMDWYKNLEVPKDSVQIIGHPRFDQSYKKPKISRTKLYKFLGLDKKKKTIAIVVRGNRWISQWRLFIETVIKEQDVNFLIRDLPGQPAHSLTEEYSCVYSSGEYDLYDILQNVDVVVSYSSTIGIEAMLTGKQVFILNKALPTYVGYYDRLDELVQEDPQELAKLVIKYFQDPDWQQYATEKKNQYLQYIYPGSDPQSGKRLKELINKLGSDRGSDPIR